MINTTFRYRIVRRFVAVLASLLALSAVAQACNTPVYRYAMYNWPSAPYRVFYFHRGDPLKEDLALNEKIDALGETLANPANVFVSTVDLSKTKLDQLPTPVKEAFEAYKEGEPTHLVFTPWGVNIFSGRLDENIVRSLTDSPARNKLAKLLEKGNAAVMLMLPGKDKEENARVEKEIKKLIATAAAGKIPTSLAFQGMPPVGPDGEVDEDAAAEANRIDVAMLKVDRSDPAEKWLVKSLMTIEPDLYDLADQPMVFAVYGRARALEPYVGKGITASNLADIVMFVADACSCMVKDMNPGADLLVKWNWDATAEKLAASDPSMDMGSPYGYGEYPADGMQEEPDTTTQEEAIEETSSSVAKEPEPVEMADATTATASAASEEAVAAPQETNAESAPEPADAESKAGTPAAEPVAEPASEPAPSDVVEVEVEEEPVPQATEDTAHSAAGNEAPASHPDESFASQQLFTYGIGLLVAAVLIVGAGFVFFKKQTPS